MQALQMRRDLWQPNWTEAANSLAAGGELTSTEVSALKSSYYLLRRCESVLRRYGNVAVSALPVDSVELTRLSRRLGFKSMDEFDQAYNGAREIIHEIYVRRLGKDPVTDGEKISPALAKQER